MWRTSIAEAQQGRGEDRIATASLPGRVIAIVADGAGGTSGGAEAADMLCAHAASEAVDYFDLHEYNKADFHKLEIAQWKEAAKLIHFAQKHGDLAIERLKPEMEP